MDHRNLAALAAIALVASSGLAQAAPSAGEAQFRGLFKEMVETDSSGATGDCTALVKKTQARMIAAGFPAKDLHVFVPEGKPRDGNLVAIYPGRDPKAKAVLMLGHIDVVNAKREDWTRDPFTLVEENGSFYARGVSDMKAQDAIWADNMLRFHQEGYKPRRTVKMALTCGEEGGGFVNGAAWLAANQRELIDAGLALTEGGGGELDADSKRLAVTVMAAEKNSVGFVLEATNPGGHSSRPRPDNAIYSLARALERIGDLEFPVQLNAANRAYFTGLSTQVDPATGAAMKAIVANPQDVAAAAILKKTPSYRAMLGTTCIPVLLEGGHASNALPQRARATVNCRMLPGVVAADVQAAVVAAIHDPEIKILGSDRPGAAKAGAPPLTPAVMDPIRKVAAQVYPGLPVVAMQETFGTDSGRLIPVGIPTYGVSGLFRQLDQGSIHGLNEHILVQSVMDGRAFMYLLIKAYADQK